ncbi:purine catabolism regulator [Alkalihalobacillus xiaoxiensis]|uniref:Purine catabolism regulator n=1 Tax=Shouchella xiaoxiensis TaxID=766895 RepID=A0ABS2T1X0_9BACI|nr:PucR family transcriptional regulator [Shouchella xiaoxiensis]MBM7841256.1 purine catabolism regulator [Shouchella xiaoxiensis]
MKLTLDQIMKLDIMKLATVKTAVNQLHHKSVEWVSITEAPVENFIRKNELVLTTGIGYGHDPKQFFEFVKDVMKSEASALAVATGRYIYELYEDARELAEAEGFPILFLPWEVRFADLTQAVTARLVDEKQSDWQFAQSVQQELLSLMLAGRDLSHFLNHVSKYTEAPLAITDHLGRVKGKVVRSHKEFDRLVLQAFTTLKASDQSTEHHPLESKVQVLDVEGESFFVVPIIQANEQIQGYLFAVRSHVNDLDINVFYLLLEHTVTAAAFWFLQESAVQEAEARIRDNFVGDLAQGVPTAQLRTKAKSIGYHLNHCYIAIVGMPHNLAELYTQSDQVASYEEWLPSMVHYMEEEAKYAGSSINREVMTTFIESQLLIYLEVEKEEYQSTVNSYLDLLDRRLTHLLPDMEMTWAIGDAKIELGAFEVRFTEAKQALKLGIGRLGKGSRIFFSDTRIDQVLFKIGTDPELRTLIDDYAAPLLSYDQLRDIDLLGTFLAYQRNQNNVSQTARVLHLHRQSLLYRLRKIEALTGLSLANPDDVFLLDLSIRILLVNRHMNEANGAQYE